MIQILVKEEGRMQTTTVHLKRGIREGNLHHSKSQSELSADPPCVRLVVAALFNADDPPKRQT